MSVIFDSNVLSLYSSLSGDSNYESPGNFNIPANYIDEINEQRILITIEVIRSYIETISSPIEAKIFKQCVTRMLTAIPTGAGIETFPGTHAAELAQTRALEFFAGHNRPARLIQPVLPHGPTSASLGPAPLDLHGGALFAYGHRALSAARYNQPLFRLRRGSDDVERTFNAASNGDPPVEDIMTWLDDADGFCTTWYDQSGNSNDVVQADSTAQPRFSLNAAPTYHRTAFDFTVGTRRLSTAGNVTISSASGFVFSTVVKLNSSISDECVFGQGWDNITPASLFDASPGSFFMRIGSAQFDFGPSIPIDGAHIFYVETDGATTENASEDGVAQTPGPNYAVQTVTYPLTVGNDDHNNPSKSGAIISELIFWNSDFDGTDARTNMAAYAGLS